MLKIPIAVLMLFLTVGRKYQTTNLKPHYNANFTTVPMLTGHQNCRCSGVPLNIFFLIFSHFLHTPKANIYFDKFVISLLMFSTIFKVLI